MRYSNHFHSEARGPQQIPTALVDIDDWAIVRSFQYGTLDDIFDASNCVDQTRSPMCSPHQVTPNGYSMGYWFLGVDPENKYAYSLMIHSSGSRLTPQ